MQLSFELQEGESTFWAVSDAYNVRMGMVNLAGLLLGKFVLIPCMIYPPEVVISSLLLRS